MSSVTLSILLVSWNTRDETEACLDSIPVGISSDVRYEIVAVDNGSCDGSAELLASYPKVRLLRNDHNIGFAAAVNQAYRHAEGKLILLLNSDVRMHPGTLSTMIEYLRQNPDAAGVSPLYLNPDGTFQQHYVNLPSFAATIALATSLRRLPGFRHALHRFQMRGEDFSRPRQLASGSCLLLRRTVLPTDWIFDERFPIYWNDAVLARTLQDAGHRLWMIPHAAVTHSRGASCRRLGPTIRQRHLLGSMIGFLALTEPRYKLIVFRAVALGDHVVKRLCNRPVTLGLGDLRAALRGDVGPLPDGDIRDWWVTFDAEQPADGRGTRPPRDPVTGPTATAEQPGTRILHLRSAPRALPRWRLTVRTEDKDVWYATLSSVLPFGAQSRWIDRLNLRIGAGQVRRWLDRQAGARVLHLADDRGAAMIGYLGEDEVRQSPAPQPDRVHA
ncbi:MULTISPECIES: glycosyltransferase family 2 protein [unclassified Solwaraspora]|uniref:glycosyltransferase family 2 protein n=1 Tax=unclassified Solwaraspora TaxID=2627926 RepID=UPI00259B6B23|nr:glycosyltransferase family 2 protein [Solwaraspora sp. WMMA2056]WJK42746.1 glycosyltransferase family 2 protein [Solwaraspora sp. WMMA2056]